MLNVISALIGIAALVAALVAFIPLLGWLNWLVIPVVAIGLVLGLFSRGAARRLGTDDRCASGDRADPLGKISEPVRGSLLSRNSKTLRPERPGVTSRRASRKL